MPRPTLAGQILRCATAPTELPDLKAPEFIHCFPAEIFNHPWIGNVDPSIPLLELLVHNNNRYEGDLVVDYNHASVDDEEAPAAGFVDYMERRPDGIWGHIAYWTDKARAAIESGEWRYISPTWFLAAWSRVDGSWIGPAWHSIALTNTPQIDGMADVPERVAAAAAAKFRPKQMGSRIYVPAELEHVFLPAAASATAARSPLFIPQMPPALLSTAASLPPTPGADSMHNFPLLLAALGLAADFNLDAEDADTQLAAAASKLVADALTAAEDSTPKAVIPAELLVELEVPAESEEPLAASLERVRVLKASTVDAKEYGELLARFSKLNVEKRVAAANLAPAAVPHARRLAAAIEKEGDAADQAFKAFIEVAPKLPTSIETPTGDTDVKQAKGPAAATSLTPGQKQIAKQLGLSEEAYAAQLSKDLGKTA